MSQFRIAYEVEECASIAYHDDVFQRKCVAYNETFATSDATFERLNDVTILTFTTTIDDTLKDHINAELASCRDDDTIFLVITSIRRDARPVYIEETFEETF